MRARTRSTAASSAGLIFGSAWRAVATATEAASSTASRRAKAAATRSVMRLEDLGSARLRQPRNLVGAFPVDRLRYQADLGVQGLVPGELLSRIGGMAAHDGEQRAGREVEVVVFRLARADRLEQHVVFALIHVVGLSLELPFDFAVGCLDPRRPGAEQQRAVGAHQVVVRRVVAAGGLPVGQ